MAISRRLLALSWCAVWLAAMPTGAGAAEAHPDARFVGAYTATLFGIPIGRISWTIDVHDHRFAAAARGKTTGLLRIFENGHGVAMARGQTADRQPRPSDFAVSYVEGRSTGRVRIEFKDGRAYEHLLHPPKPDPAKVPLTDAYRKGVVDPMTAMLIRVPGNGATVTRRACHRTIAVFDGRIRYDLRLAFKRFAQVRADTGYRGPAVVCAVYFLPLAGYDPGRSAIKYLRAERDMEMWLAPLAGTRLLVPFRVSVPTPLGLGVVQATRFVSIPQRQAAGKDSH